MVDRALVRDAHDDGRAGHVYTLDCAVPHRGSRQSAGAGKHLHLDPHVGLARALQDLSKEP